MTDNVFKDLGLDPRLKAIAYKCRYDKDNKRFLRLASALSNQKGSK